MIEMKVLVYRYNSICEPGYIAAFRALGITVVEYRQDREQPALSLKERMAALAELILAHRPLFVFSINYFPFISMVCDRFRALYTSVSVDCPVFEIYDVTIRNACNRIFLFDRAQYLSVRDENPAGIFHLPLGTDVEQIEAAAGSYEMFCGREEYDYDVSFVGSLYNEKDAYAELALIGSERARMDELMEAQRSFSGLSYLEEALTDADVEILRRNASVFRPSSHSVRDISRRYAIDHYLSDHLTCIDRMELLNGLAANLPEGRCLHLFTQSDACELRGVIRHGGVNSSTEMPLVFRRSRININPTMRAIRTGLPQRIWDVLGSGGFLLTNAQEEIPDVLEIGKHLDVYENEEDLMEKVQYWLAHEEERREIARTGYQEVRERHTVLCRVISMIPLIGKQAD